MLINMLNSAREDFPSPRYFCRAATDTNYKAWYGVGQKQNKYSYSSKGWAIYYTRGVSTSTARTSPRSQDQVVAAESRSTRATNEIDGTRSRRGDVGCSPSDGDGTEFASPRANGVAGGIEPSPFTRTTRLESSVRTTPTCRPEVDARIARERGERAARSDPRGRLGLFNTNGDASDEEKQNRGFALRTVLSPREQRSRSTITLLGRSPRASKVAAFFVSWIARKSRRTIRVRRA